MTPSPKSKSHDLTAAELAEVADLDSASAGVWRLADGKRTVPEIAEALAVEFDTPADRELVWACLDHLFDLGLLEARVTPPAGNHALSRRGVLRNVMAPGGLIGLAAIAVPGAAMAAANAEEQAHKSKPELRAQEQKEKRKTSVQRAEEQRNKRLTASSNCNGNPECRTMRQSANEERIKRDQRLNKPTAEEAKRK